MTENVAGSGPAGHRRAASRAVAAADLVFDSIMQSVDPDHTTQLGAPTGAHQLRLRSSLARSADRYADLLQRVVSGFADEISETVVGAAANNNAQTDVTLSGRPGATAGAFVWIHNTQAELLPEFRLRLTDLTHADGHRLSPIRREINPAVFAASALERRSAWVSVTVPADARAGIYYGHVLAEGLADAAVSVRLVVT